MRKMPLSLFILVLAGRMGTGLLGAEAQPSLSVHVVPEGARAETAAVHSLVEARDRIRQWRIAGGSGSITVRVEGGKYFLSEPIELGQADSGTAANPIHYEASEGVRLIGGTELKMPAVWKEGEELIISPPIPIQGQPLDSRLGRSRPNFDVIWGGRRLALARWPNASLNDSPLKGWAYLEAAPVAKSRDRFVCHAIPINMARNLIGAEVHIFSQPEWWDEVIEVSAYDAVSGELKLARAAKYPLETGARFYLQNIRAALDAPGEWWFDTSRNEIHLLAPEAGTSNTEVYISRVATLLWQHDVSHVVFRGFTWEGSTGDAIVLENVDDCEFSDNRIHLIGGWGVVATTNGRLSLDGNIVDSIGLGGLKLSGGDRRTLTPARITANNNTLTDVAQSVECYMPGFWLEGVGVAIGHNRISHLPHNAIMFFGNNHRIAGNIIEDVCRETNDVGAVYAYRDWSFRGTVIEENVFRRIAGLQFLESAGTGNTAPPATRYVPGGRAHAVYMDDLMEGTVIRNNVFEDIDSAAIHLGGGSYHAVTGNYFIHVERGLLISTRGGFSLQRNGVVPFLAAGSPYLTAYPELVDREAHDPLTPSHIRWENNHFIDVPAAYDLRLLGTQNTFAQNHFSSREPGVNATLKKGATKESIKNWVSWQTAGFDTDAKLNAPLGAEEKRAMDKIVSEAGPRKK